MQANPRQGQLTFYVPELADRNAIARMDTALRALDAVSEFRIDRRRLLVGVTYLADRTSHDRLKEYIRVNGFKSVQDT